MLVSDWSPIIILFSRTRKKVICILYLKNKHFYLFPFKSLFFIPELMFPLENDGPLQLMLDSGQQWISMYFYQAKVGTGL